MAAAAKVFSNKSKITVIVLFFLLLSGCVTGEKVSRINLGMSSEQVIDVLGKPDGYKEVNEYIVYRYTNRLISGWSWDRADYSFIFKQNKLVEYGAGEVRERSIGGAQSLFIYQM